MRQRGTMQLWGGGDATTGVLRYLLVLVLLLEVVVAAAAGAGAGGNPKPDPEPTSATVAKDAARPIAADA
eukprot:COSAG01_NODE_72896_length_251_cov_2.144737_1_plen_69_part_10